MTRELVPTIIVGALLIAGFFNGMRRGSLKEGTALVGVLLGALLVEYWAERWGIVLNQRSGINVNQAKFLSSVVLLIGTALFSGYGSGLLLRRGAIKGGERLGGGFLGLLNMGLLVSFTLRNIQRYYYQELVATEPIETWVRANVLTRWMLNWVGYVLLGAAFALGLIAIITSTVRIGRRAAKPAPAPAKAPSKAPADKPAVGGAPGAKPADKPAAAPSAGAPAGSGLSPGAGGAGAGKDPLDELFERARQKQGSNH